MIKKRNKLKGLKIFSALLMSTSLLPMTSIYAEEAIQEADLEEVVQEDDSEEIVEEAEQLEEEIESSQSNSIMSVSKKGWVQEGSKRYYYNDKGIKHTGWLTLGKDQYYLDADGIMQTGHMVIGKNMHFFKPNGVLDSSLADLNKNPTPQQFIDTAAPYAKVIAKKHGLYASVIVAQASLETGYGKSVLSKSPNYNLFGIKGSYNGQSVNVFTQEDDGKGNLTTIRANFRKYPSYQESFNDHADKMINGVSWDKNIYRGAWRANTNNYTDATAALTGVYATDINYYSKLNSIIQRFKLYELDGDTLVTNPRLPKGWQNLDNNWYHIDVKGNKQTGWLTIKNQKYYMNSKGVMQTGFVKVNGKTYFMNNDGVMQTGLIKHNNKNYYLNNKGEMQTGWVNINNKWRIFDDNGAEQVSSPNGGVLNKNTAKRLYGPRRIETSIQVSKEMYPDRSAKNVMITGFNGEADALTGTLLAASKDAPLLLVDNYDSIKLELTRLGAENIYILGGTSVVSTKVEQELKAAKYNVIRVAGKDRFETAVKVAEKFEGNKDHVFLTNDGRNDNLADALAIGPVSGKKKKPILLTTQSKLPKQTLDALIAMDVAKVTIIGGEIVVSDAVKKELQAHNIEVNRIAGKDRYETAEKIANQYFKGSEKAIVTNDGHVSFADALMGGYLGAKADAPILLTAPEKLGRSTENYLKTSATSAYVLGGEKVIQGKNLSEIERSIRVIIK